jgi:hypothetical protein
MNPFRSAEPFLQAFGASVAGVFLVLACCASIQEPSRGVWYELLRPGPDDCGDGSPVVVHLEPEGQVGVNGKNLGVQAATGLIGEMMSTRAERAVHFLPQRRGTVQEVASLSDRIESSADQIHLGLVTARDQKSVTRVEHGWTITNIECMRWPQCPAVWSDTIPILHGCK